MLQWGRFTVETINFGFFRLDGGSMFGSVPKNLWSKRIGADEENCIRLATRCLLVKDGARCFLVDVGMGEKWSDKQRQIFGIENLNPQFDATAVTDVVLTHLHFDHAGGISRYKNGNSGELELCYPKARVYLQEANWKVAKNPSVRERASYLPENIEPLEKANLTFTHGSQEIYPDFWVHQVDGHTEGQQWIELRNGDTSMVYPTDLIPTSRHLPLPFVMGYDMCVRDILKEKEAFLTQALAKKSVIVFEHDPDTPAVRIKKDDKGHFAVDQVVEL
jgi:glyoxylase-like metal-dependent hydrolase (beta-lactamase superfamily II)